MAKRLASFNIQTKLVERFGEKFLQFEDVHGLQLELVEREGGEQNKWTFGRVTPEVAIKGFAGAVLYSTNPDQTARVLQEVMGLGKVGEEENYIRFQSDGEIGNIIDLYRAPVRRGTMGVGTVHHIAWRANDKEDHRDWQTYVRQHGYFVTEVRDRNYFDAIYFHEHGEILFEIATDPPGFMHDESYDTMGSELKLPQQYEKYRERLMETLISIEVRQLDRGENE